ncbi:phosphodiester glycosidase family protein [Williamsia deligens]|nr:putative protein (DUF2233) [Williamsia deligens]
MVAAQSYVRALTAPGYSTVADITSAWLRSHGARSLVDGAEAWWYSHHRPSQAPADVRRFPTTTTTDASVALPTLPTPSGGLHPPGWQVAARDSTGRPAVYTSLFEPDPALPSVVASVAVLPAVALRAHLVLGTAEPRRSSPSGIASVPPADVPHLIATLNSGFRFSDITGGVVADGRTVRALRDGQATAAIDDRGQLTVGEWGRDVHPDGHLVAARQNLELIVDAGAALPRAGRSDSRWGGAHLQYQFTWRSALGVDRHHDIVYVAGNRMDLAALAEALVAAGAVRGMELDMHSGMTAFSTWAPGADGTRMPTKLIAAMPGPADRYLEPDRRDFFYLTEATGKPARAAAPTAGAR